MTKNKIVREIVLSWLSWWSTELDYLAFIEAFPDEVFEEYADDDRELQDLYQKALDELETVRYVYEKHP